VDDEAIAGISRAGWGVRLAQMVGAVPRSMDPDRLEAKARKATGLSDFGDPYYRPGLERMCASLDADARLNAYGYTLCEGVMTGFLQSPSG
jgi:hypothetical protein